MQAKKMREIKSGEYFKRKTDSNIVYVKGEYDREMKKYWGYKFEDICEGRFFGPNSIVYVGFTF